MRNPPQSNTENSYPKITSPLPPAFNPNGLSILILFLLTPLTVLASGQYVLTGLFIDLVVFIIIMIAIIKVKIKWTGKLILGIVYIGTMFLLFYLIDQVNYLENLNMINLGSGLLPLTTFYLTYLAIKKNQKK